MFEVQVHPTVKVTSEIVTPWGDKGKVTAVFKTVSIQVINDFPADRAAVDIFEEYCVSIETKLSNKGAEMSPEAARKHAIENNWLGGKLAQDWMSLMVRGAPKK